VLDQPSLDAAEPAKLLKKKRKKNKALSANSGKKRHSVCWRYSSQASCTENSLHGGFGEPTNLPGMQLQKHVHFADVCLRTATMHTKHATRRNVLGCLRAKHRATRRNCRRYFVLSLTFSEFWTRSPQTTSHGTLRTRT
jgi:hypothetical protein